NLCVENKLWELNFFPESSESLNGGDAEFVHLLHTQPHQPFHYFIKAEIIVNGGKETTFIAGSNRVNGLETNPRSNISSGIHRIIIECSKQSRHYRAGQIFAYQSQHAHTKSFNSSNTTLNRTCPPATYQQIH